MGVVIMNFEMIDTRMRLTTKMVMVMGDGVVTEVT